MAMSVGRSWYDASYARAASSNKSVLRPAARWSMSPTLFIAPAIISVSCCSLATANARRMWCRPPAAFPTVSSRLPRFM